MTKETYRTKIDVYATILEVVRLGPRKITKLSYGVGVPLDRLKKIVEDLCSFGLLREIVSDNEIAYTITQRGSEFLETYWKMKGFLEVMGGGNQLG